MPTLKTGAGLADVVVTAIVSTTSVAPDVEETWRALLAGDSGIRPLDKPFVDEFDLPVRIAGAIREDVDAELNRVELRRLSYLQKVGLVLSRRLWTTAGLDDDGVDTKRLFVAIGTALGTTEEAVAAYDGFVAKGLRAVSPLAVQMLMPNAPAAAIGLERKAKAGIITPLTGASSGAMGIAEAWRHLALGEADVAICGGVDGVITAATVAAFDRLGLLSTDNDDPEGAAKPFDVNRNGMVFSEGGALVMLETEEHARARNAPILARILGVGITSDSFDVVGLDPSGEIAADAISRAIELSNLQPGDIDVVIADAAGTAKADLAEATALHLALGDHRPAVYASKGALGHSWGSSGAIDAILAVQALRDQIVPATRNVQSVDPAVDLDVVTGEPRTGEYRYALVDSFGFSGNNVALVFGKA
jgi:beta-ketoacyl ACP synthase